MVIKCSYGSVWRAGTIDQCCCLIMRMLSLSIIPSFPFPLLLLYLHSIPLLPWGPFIQQYLNKTCLSPVSSSPVKTFFHCVFTMNQQLWLNKHSMHSWWSGLYSLFSNPPLFFPRPLPFPLSLWPAHSPNYLCRKSLETLGSNIYQWPQLEPFWGFSGHLTGCAGLKEVSSHMVLVKWQRLFVLRNLTRTSNREIFVYSRLHTKIITRQATLNKDLACPTGFSIQWPLVVSYERCNLVSCSRRKQFSL